MRWYGKGRGAEGGMVGFWFLVFSMGGGGSWLLLSFEDVVVGRMPLKRSVVLFREDGRE